MGKPSNAAYEAFSKRYAELNREAGLKQYLVPYFISAHPGAGLREAVELAEYLRDTGFLPDQVQDFYPTPGTLSTAMYWTGMDPATGEAVHVARGERERAMQRALLQYDKKREPRARPRGADTGGQEGSRRQRAEVPGAITVREAENPVPTGADASQAINRRMIASQSFASMNLGTG
jgi:radical SAM superfamily enzyme YgiQ (UPF0313 family)